MWLCKTETNIVFFLKCCDLATLLYYLLLVVSNNSVPGEISLYVAVRDSTHSGHLDYQDERKVLVTVSVVTVLLLAEVEERLQPSV